MIPREVLERFAPKPEPTKSDPTKPGGKRAAPVNGTLDLRRWMQQYGSALGEYQEKAHPKYKHLFTLSKCPFNGEHDNGEVHVHQEHDGKLGAGCKHNSCTWGWTDLREKIEPGYVKPQEAGAGNACPELDTKLAELAQLSPIEYDQQRQGAAEALGIRTSTLDAEVDRRRPKDSLADAGVGCRVACEDPAPWPHRVDGGRLANKLVETFNRYIVLPAGAAVALVLWVLHSHGHAAAHVSPILAISSPEKRCGKTTLLSLLGALVRRALPVANITAAALFRVTELWRPTLLIDEADSFLQDNEDLRGILNSGHNRAGAYVIRTTGDDHEPRVFSTWAPKSIALIGKMHPTLTDRSVVVPLRRKLPNERVERLRLDRLDGLAELAQQACRWAEDNLSALRDADPSMPSGMNDRAADNWRALLAIADLIGGEWPEQARLAVAQLTATDDGDEAAGVMLLEDVRKYFKESGGSKAPSAKLIEALGRMEERPWPEWKDGKPLTQRQLAKLLKPYGIKPQAERIGDKTLRGYDPADFADAFSRYLSPLADPQQCNNVELTPKSNGSDPQHYEPSVSDRDSARTFNSKDCCAVADQKQGSLWEASL